eukprot:Seg1628.2 transcript_id=Seg1628.2/GoldUCD/mRNA.D3Y31 product="Protein-glutamine gamma-glutamyltransferase K" protein_id=Seg1628.2/GoldUCD/D3Y31
MGGAYSKCCLPSKGLPVSNVDLLKERNSKQHHTEKFQSKSLVVRRGEALYVDLHLKEDYKKEAHDFQIVFRTGNQSRQSDKSKVVVRLVDNLDKTKWGMVLVGTSKDRLQLKISIPADCIVAKYMMTIESAGSILHDQQEQVFILFNPWVQEDEVYMPNELWLNEYILNDHGILYQGSSNSISANRWYFGQFEEVSLEAAFEVLRQTGIRGRDTAREVARRVSAMVNANDDGGVVMGNWGKDFTGGVEPWSWTGSPEILEQYVRTKTPVNFGQCWVFCGVTTTIMRALGVPTRAISNFNSAHDTDANCTFDRFYDENGEYLAKMSGDSSWNFHCWNDCWMARPDIAPGYGGWQAVDATPQERSKGLYQLGPAPLKAVKEGNVDMIYDTRFVFAEVNADTVSWKRDVAGASFKPFKVDRKLIGQHISTKAIGRNNWERVDISDDYKYPEGSTLEDVAVRRALRKSNNPAIRPNSKDITFTMRTSSYVYVGHDVRLTIEMRNTGMKTLQIQATVSGNVVMYNGVALSGIPAEKTEVRLGPYASTRHTVTVPASEYLKEIKSNPRLSLHVMCLVKETGQAFASEEIVTIWRPDITFEALPNRWLLGKQLTFFVRVRNPLDTELTDCVLRVNGNVMKGQLVLPQRNVQPNGSLQMSVVFIPEFDGERDISVSFSSKQIGGFQGHAFITIRKSNGHY